MSLSEMIQDLKSRGEHSISVLGNGWIASWHGKNTINYWTLKDGEIICISCKTVGYF